MQINWDEGLLLYSTIPPSLPAKEIPTLYRDCFIENFIEFSLDVLSCGCNRDREKENDKKRAK